MFGVKCRFECPSCGNIIVIKTILEQGKEKYSFKASPKRCGCGRRTGHKLLGFEQIGLQFVEEQENGTEE